MGRYLELCARWQVDMAQSYVGLVGSLNEPRHATESVFLYIQGITPSWPGLLDRPLINHPSHASIQLLAIPSLSCWKITCRVESTRKPSWATGPIERRRLVDH